MRLNDIISQQESIRANSVSVLDTKAADSEWQKDITALDEALAILRSMNQQSWWKKLLFRAQYIIACRFHRTGGWK